jgi:hypothetical protein
MQLGQKSHRELRDVSFCRELVLYGVKRKTNQGSGFLETHLPTVLKTKRKNPL